MRKSIRSGEGRSQDQRPGAMRGWAFHGSAARSRCGWILALLGIALGLPSQLSLGQTTWQFDKCLNDCMNICASGPPQLRWGCQEGCGDKCADQNKNLPTPYGAIAFGTGGAEGISWNKANWAAANSAAITPCSRYANDCKVVYRYQNTCAALAVAKGAQHFEVATGSTKKEAEASATAACQQRWGACKADLSACSLTNASQSSQSSKPNPPAPPRATSWGAIAYSAADMGAGWSQGKSERSLAEKEAMSICSQRGKACVLETVFNKQCGALAADRTFVGWATSTEPREAQQKALAECTKDGGARCALHILFCSF